MLVSVFTRCTPLNWGTNWGTLGYKNLKIIDTGQVLEIKNGTYFTPKEFDVMIKTRYSSERLVIFYMINQQLFHLDLFLHKIKKLNIIILV